MKNKIYRGVNDKMGDLLVNRLLTAHHPVAIGPMILLYHVYPVELKKYCTVPHGNFAQPHRGIATFSIVLQGSLTNYNSIGNRHTIHAGGVQWMKAGNGIVYEEKPFITGGNAGIFHALQFWVNLPPAIKAEDPAYIALAAAHIPEIELPDHAGLLRVLLGCMGSFTSPITTFCQEFIYHIKLNPRSVFRLPCRNELEYAAFIPADEVTVNETIIANSKIIAFDRDEKEILFENPGISKVDIMVFGGHPYTWPIIKEGPFVMNSRAEIAEAYRDFFDGRYGTIKYT